MGSCAELKRLQHIEVSANYDGVPADTWLIAQNGELVAA